jgi:diguanylate cyclase (GGDEF)-like protein
MGSLLRLRIGASNAHGSRELIERLRWVIGLRWTVVIALFLIGIISRFSSGESPEASVFYAALALLLLVYNLFYLFASRRPDFGHSGLTRLLRFGQVPVDLAVITVLVHFRGGYTGPVFVLYFVYVFVGLAILPPSGAYWVAGLAAIFYGALIGYEAVWNRLPSGTLVNGQASIISEPRVYLSYFLIVSATLMMTAYIANYYARLLTRDEGTIRRQLGELNTLYNVASRMSTTLNSDEVMRTLLSMASEVASPAQCWLLLFNEHGKGVLGATLGVSADERSHYGQRTISLAHPLARQLATDHRGIFAPDVSASPDLEPLLIRRATRSLYALPLLNDGRLQGVLCLSYDLPHTMPGSHWTLLNTVAQQAALAIERTRLFTEAERAAREMTGLYHIGLATTSSLQIDEVLRLLYEQINKVVRPDTFYIGLYDEDLAELRFDMFVEGGEFLPPFRAKLGDGVTAWVIRNRRPVFIRNWDAEIEQLPFEAGIVGVPTQSLISVPLMAKSKMVGVISVQSVTADAFDQDHLRLLTSIAGQAALALENAKLHAEVHEQAQRDPLTGVYNHGVFIDKLHSMIKQASVDNSTVALIMLDIDRFKPYNDTYGHMVGDDVLRSIVVAIQNHLKSTDVVGRWGGEEFGIILPDVTRVQARLVADRIRSTAAHTVLHDLHNRSIPSPTVSQGLAMFCEDAATVEDLIDRADSALYRAKDLGRNQIAEWADMHDDRGPISLRASG